ncbi:hypothetical protein ABZY90_00255 [Streptomyces sp. NPDC006422]|uniref:hypothetical protein n=1 Tax=unclassified Streptomyces TaxID=2593676 RepID=UPI0033B169BD
MSNKTIRRPLFTWFPVAAGAGFYACALGVAAFMPQAGFAPSLLVTAMALFLWALGWNSAVRITHTHVSITNFVVTTTVAWTDVEQVTMDDGLGIHLRDGNELGSIAFGGSLIGAFTGYPSHRRAYRLLRDAQQRAGGGRRRRLAGDVEIQHSIDWRRPLVAVASLYTPLLIVFAIAR